MCDGFDRRKKIFLVCEDELKTVSGRSASYSCAVAYYVNQKRSAVERLAANV